MSSDLRGKTVFITGASRGIGKAIGLALAARGANIVIAAKTSEPHASLVGTIHSAAGEMQALGVHALGVQCDVRSEEQVQAAIEQAVSAFGGIDVLVNNASAISLTNTEQTSMKRFDLMHQVNVRATFMVTRAALPYLRAADNPHVLTLSPPLSLEPRWLGPHLAYTLSKYGMSLCVLGHAAEFAPLGIAVNALWPRTLIATAAIANMPSGEQLLQRARSPRIVADAACAILSKDSRSFTGNFCIDEDVLREAGVSDFEGYLEVPGSAPLGDLFIE